MTVNSYEPPKAISFPSDIHGVRVKDGKEEIKVLCNDNQYHWVNINRYNNQ